MKFALQNCSPKFSSKTQELILSYVMLAKLSYANYVHVLVDNLHF